MILRLRHRHLYGCVIAVTLAILLMGIGSRDVAGQRPAVALDADDISGVVTGPRGPEAGVWVEGEGDLLDVCDASSVPHRNGEGNHEQGDQVRGAP